MDITKARVAQADKIIGKQGMLHGNKDSDGDKVINILDCQPYNKKEQGWIHRATAAMAEKVGATGTAERIRSAEVKHEEREAREENIRRDAKQAGAKVYFDKKKEIAIQREEQRAVRKAEGLGGVAKRTGSFAKKFIDQPNKTGAVTSKINKPTTKLVTTTKRVKIKSGKGKGKYRTVKVKTRVPVKQQTQQRTQGMPNIFVGSSSSNPSSNSASTPSLFNTNKGKEKAYKVPKIF